MKNHLKFILHIIYELLAVSFGVYSHRDIESPAKSKYLCLYQQQEHPEETVVCLVAMTWNKGSEIKSYEPLSLLIWGKTYKRKTVLLLFPFF